jgi:hypothetical protein
MIKGLLHQDRIIMPSNYEIITCRNRISAYLDFEVFLARCVNGRVQLFYCLISITLTLSFPWISSAM